MKTLTLSVDPERLKSDPELETQFLKLHGRDALNKVYSEDEGFDYSEEQIEAMTDQEFEENRDKIHKAMAEGRIK